MSSRQAVRPSRLQRPQSAEQCLTALDQSVWLQQTHLLARAKMASVARQALALSPKATLGLGA